MSLEAHHRFILDTMQRNQDIARNIINELEAENARLKADNDRLKEAIADSYKAVDEMEQRFKALEAEFETHPMAAEIARLKAEFERLTKAGDWVMSHWSSGDGSDEVRFCQALLKWKNAKEGKPQP